MELKILVRTPKGQAKGTQKKLQPFLLGIRKIKETYVNDEDSEMVWLVETTPRDMIKISRNVALYANLIQMIFQNKTMQKFIGSKISNISKEQQAELKDMLENQTTVEIVKNATAQEMVEANKTWWQKVKETFKRNDSEPQDKWDYKGSV